MDTLLHMYAIRASCKEKGGTCLYSGFLVITEAPATIDFAMLECGKVR